jgi:hypothetical protein
VKDASELVVAEREQALVQTVSILPLYPGGRARTLNDSDDQKKSKIKL